jgi:Tfp pilus assembly PilM family ATPase
MSVFSNWISLRDAAPPAAALELAAHQVSGVRLELRGREAVIAAHAAESLPDGALVPSLTARNIENRAAVATAIGRVLDQIGRPSRVGLVVPDAVAKVSFVRFEQVPARVLDLEKLIRWQMRKAAPFPVEEAQVSYVNGPRITEGQEFIVSLARRETIVEYEEVVEAAGTRPGVVDLSTFNVINAVLAGSSVPAGDWLLVNVASHYASIAIMRGAQMIFFRSRSADADETLTDLVHQTAMYYEDRLQGTGFSRVLLAGAAFVSTVQAADVNWIRSGLEERLGLEVEPVDVRSTVALTDRISAGPQLLDTLSPLVGMLLRNRESAA